MTTSVEQLQALADQWAQKLGGKIRVGLQILVDAGPGTRRPYFCADLGPVADGWHSGSPNSIEQAMNSQEVT